MANSPGMCSNFKHEILVGSTHNLNGGTFKMALYTSGGSIGVSTAVYTSASELSSTNYTAGGTPISNGTVQTTAPFPASAIWTPAAAATWNSIVYTNLDCALLYNSGNTKTVASFTFTPQSSGGGNFTLTMPANVIGTALIQIT